MKMEGRLKPLALGLAFGIIDVLWLLLLSILARFGYAQNAAWIMINFLPGYSLGPSGIAVGGLECGISGFATGCAVAYLYNLFTQA